MFLVSAPRSLVLALAAAGAALLAGQARAQVLPVPENVVQLSAVGSVEVPQDYLAITLSTTREAADAATLQTQLKAAIDLALAEARKQAADGQMEVRTGAFSLYPRHTKEGRISTWQGTAELVLSGRDFARISSTAGRVPGLGVREVAFSLSREERARVETQAQAQAIALFQAKAGEIARSFGFASYSLREVSVMANDAGVPHQPRVMAMQAKAAYESAPVPVEAGKAVVAVTVSGGVQLKP